MARAGAKPGSNKGVIRNPAGRPKGIQDKRQKEFQEIRDKFKELIHDNLDNMNVWLAEVARDNPAKALDIIDKYAEYVMPKLSRAEISGIDGKPIETTQNNMITLAIDDQTKGLLDNMKKQKDMLELPNTDFEVVENK